MPSSRLMRMMSGGAVLVALGTFLAPQGVWAASGPGSSGSGSSGSGSGGEARLRAQLVAPVAAGDVSGRAEFRNEPSRPRRRFSVEIEGFVPGQQFDVMVAGVVVGTITVNGLGQGDLNLDSNFDPEDDDPATQLPANFPALDGGELVQVGPLTGTLQVN